MRTNRVYAIALLIAVALVGASACAAKATPARVAHHAADATDAVTALQRWTTQNVDAGALPVAVGRRITDANQNFVVYATRLSAALRAVESTTDLSIRTIKIEEAEQIIVDFDRALRDTLSVPIPEGLAANFSALVGAILNVLQQTRAALGRPSA